MILFNSVSETSVMPHTEVHGQSTSNSRGTGGCSPPKSCGKPIPQYIETREPSWRYNVWTALCGYCVWVFWEKSWGFFFQELREKLAWEEFDKRYQPEMIRQNTSMVTLLLSLAPRPIFLWSCIANLNMRALFRNSSVQHNGNGRWALPTRYYFFRSPNLQISTTTCQPLILCPSTAHAFLKGYAVCVRHGVNEESRGG